MSTTILYHKKCNDGFIAALNYYTYYKELGTLNNVDFMPVQYGEPLPDEKYLRNKEVFILDFSFSREDTLKLIDMASEVIMLDHHKTAKDNLFTGLRLIDDIQPQDNEDVGTYILKSKALYLKVHLKESGATLAFEDIGRHVQSHSKRERLQLLSKYAKDRDLWNFYYEETKAFYEYSSSMNFDLEKGYELLVCSNPTDFESKIIFSQARVDMRDELAREYASKRTMIDFMGYNVPCVNVASNFASIVGDILDKEHPFAVMYAVGSDKVYMSLRSDNKTGVDVERIAKILGGGGHVNAAGCSIPIDQLPDLLKGKINMEYLSAYASDRNNRR